VRASTSGHATLIRDEGNTDPRHGGKMPVKLSYKNPIAGVLEYYAEISLQPKFAKRAEYGG